MFRFRIRTSLGFLPRIAGVTLENLQLDILAICFLPRIAGVTPRMDVALDDYNGFLPRIAGVTLKLGQLWQVCHRFLSRIAGVTLFNEWLLEKLLLLSSPYSGGYSIDITVSDTWGGFLPRVAGVTPVQYFDKF